MRDQFPGVSEHDYSTNLTKQFRGASTGIADFAIYEQGAPMFWLNVNSPVEPDPNTG